MKRKIYNQLKSWKNTKESLPLMILGARQVGKTYIIREFCKKEYNNFIEINLFQRDDIVELYKMNISSDEKFLKLKAYLGTDIKQNDTILFIDEIQESEELISELKYFNEQHPDLRIIVAGSLLGVKLKRNKSSFPVGKVKILNLYPMEFEEFLIAFNEKFLIEEIYSCYENNQTMPDALHEKCLNYYRLYLCCGGMPASVQDLINNNADITKYDETILEDIITSYFNDMNKYVASRTESLRIEKTYRSIPSQLLNESNKFQYSKITSSAKSREYEIALSWLDASNLIIKSYQVSAPNIPLKGFEKPEYFKVFLSDVGILTRTLGFKYQDILKDNISFYKGAIAKNYVANQLIANNFNLNYWTSDGKAEIDFLLYTEDGIIPMEVKSGDTTKSKSLNVYKEKYNPKYAIRVSTKNFGYVNNIKSIPLYAIFCIKE